MVRVGAKIFRTGKVMQKNRLKFCLLSTATPLAGAGRDGQQRPLYGIAVLSMFTMLAWFLWEGRASMSLSDEGFLWYGVQRVLQGEVPIRDFMAYDPGRYYLSAALMALRGDDILSLRTVLAVIQGLALFVALALIAKSARQRDLWFLAISAMTLAVWLVPRHKAFDITLSVGLVAVLTVVVLKPSLRRVFLSGCFVGLAAVFGRNHGVYSAIASLAVILLLVVKDNSAPPLPRALAYWSAGIVLGYLPVLLMLLLVPGFANAFWASIRFLWEFRATNLPLPVPWPWQVELADGLNPAGLRAVLTGALFVSVLVVAFAGPIDSPGAALASPASPPGSNRRGLCGDALFPCGFLASRSAPSGSGHLSGADRRSSGHRAVATRPSSFARGRSVRRKSFRYHADSSWCRLLRRGRLHPRRGRWQQPAR